MGQWDQAASQPASQPASQQASQRCVYFILYGRFYNAYGPMTYVLMTHVLKAYVYMYIRVMLAILIKFCSGCYFLLEHVYFCFLLKHIMVLFALFIHFRHSIRSLSALLIPFRSQ